MYNSRLVVTAACILCALSLLTGPIRADEEQDFSLSKLSVADKLLELVWEDLDEDGFDDILIIHRKGLEPDETRWISIFWQSQDGGFSTAADQSWEIDTASVILDTGNVAGDERKEIIYLTSDAVHYYPIGSDRYETTSRILFETGGLTVFPSKRSIPLINFVRDWNGDGIEEVAVFKFEGLSIYSAGVDGMFISENRILIELDTGMSSDYRHNRNEQTLGLHAVFGFPDLRLVDYNNDGRVDLIATTEDRVVVYTQQPDGRFSETADADVLFDVRTKKEKLEDLAHLETEIADINNDGYADAVITKQTSKGLSNFRGVINIYFGRDGGFSDEPDQVIISEGTASARTYLQDVNGDDRLDLILPSIKISVTSIIRWLITRNVPINFNIFLLNEEGSYSDRPDFTKEVKFKIDWSGESDTQAIDLEGDYNGDRRSDFVFATNENELSVYLGIPPGGDRLFSKKPVTKVEADAFGELYSPDLNGDDYSDMIIFYPNSKERKGMIQVLMNRGGLEH